jgi:IS30 family transposase
MSRRKKYKQLDFRKRCQIYGLWKAGYNQTEIAKEIGVHKSTISREFKRNTQVMRTQWGKGSDFSHITENELGGYYGSIE